MNISRHHARIFYDFQRRRFALEVLGKNGCSVEGVLHLPGNPPVKLDSQDLLQIGDKEFYFLLPIRSILGGQLVPSRRHMVHSSPAVAMPPHTYLPPPTGSAQRMAGAKKGGRGKVVSSEYLEDEYDDDDRRGEDEGLLGSGSGGKRARRDGHEGFGYPVPVGKAVLSGQLEKKGDGRSRVDREADNHQLQQLEEKDVVSCVATLLSDLCGPGEWMPMEKLHAELVEQYSTVWHHGRVRRYLTSEDWPGPESKGKPWYGLLMLLRKYPEHFVINTRSKGRVTLEFVSLVSLLS